MSRELRLALLVAAAFGIAGAAGAAVAAEKYPAKPIRLVVPFPPGFASDFLARTVGQRLGEIYSQQVVIDNRPGAGGLIGSRIGARAFPDGYTLIHNRAREATREADHAESAIQFARVAC